MSAASHTSLLVIFGLLAASPVALSSAAWAQDGLEAESAPLTELVYAADTMELRRWSDSEVMVKSVAKGTQLQVLMRDGEQVRVLLGTAMGWASADQLLSEAPGEEEAAEGILELGGPPSLGFGGMPSGGLGGLPSGGLGTPPPSLPAPSGE